MSQTYQVGCKSCASVLKLQLSNSSSRIEVNLDNTASTRGWDSKQRCEITCRKCNKVAAVIQVGPS